jgi:hypothetical protein
MDCEAFGNTPTGQLMPIRGYDQFLKRVYAHFAFVPHP